MLSYRRGEDISALSGAGVLPSPNISVVTPCVTLLTTRESPRRNGIGGTTDIDETEIPPFLQIEPAASDRDSRRIPRGHRPPRFPVAADTHVTVEPRRAGTIHHAAVLDDQVKPSPCRGNTGDGRLGEQAMAKAARTTRKWRFTKALRLAGMKSACSSAARTVTGAAIRRCVDVHARFLVCRAVQADDTVVHRPFRRYDILLNTLRTRPTSPGSVKFGSDAIAIIGAADAASSMLPHQTGTPFLGQKSRIRDRRCEHHVDAARLDVHDAAAAERHHVLHGSRLVIDSSSRSAFSSRLQFGVPHDAVVPAAARSSSTRSRRAATRRSDIIRMRRHCWRRPSGAAPDL